MHKDTPTRTATLTYIRLDGYRESDRRFEEDGNGHTKKETLDERRRMQRGDRSRQERDRWRRGEGGWETNSETGRERVRGEICF